MIDYVAIVDISEHQGVINFEVMRSKGVHFLIMRVSHGMTLDKRFGSYYKAALAAGYQPWQIAFYSFINPKRGSAKATAEFAASVIRDVTGRTVVTYMPDIESYRAQTPNAGTITISGIAFSKYIQDHVKAFQDVMPGCYTKLHYTNRAFWNSAEGPNDDIYAATVEWMVPRYPLDTPEEYQLRGYPPAPNNWDEYAFKLQPLGPVPPRGGKWRGWQFSAEYNMQGRPYGCSSDNLDLNFADVDYAVKWFPAPSVPTPSPIPTPIEPEVPQVYIPHKGQRLPVAMKFPAGTTVVDVLPGTPDEATGVGLNITVNGSLVAGYASFWAGSDTPPVISQINWPIHSEGNPAGNSFTITQIVDGQFLVNCTAEVNLLLDQVGYTMPPVPGPQGPQGPAGIPGPPGAGATPEQIVKAVSDALND